MAKPTIRFKGYQDDWEQRKLGDVVEDYVEKTTVEDQYPVLIPHLSEKELCYKTIFSQGIE
ncbi:MAG: hypothetical protein ACLTR4_01510 [Gallintestinimicrobium sp.]